MSHAVVLLSSGLDSTFNLFRAKLEHKVALALTFDYGQKAAKQEIARARDLAALVSVPHQVVELSWFRAFTQTSLVGEQKIPMGKDVEIDDMKTSMQTMKSVWVPNRNGILLNIAAGFAEGLRAEYVIPGFNLEEASTFPDNSQSFIDALNHAFGYSTLGRVKVLCYSTAMSKTEIVKEAVKLNLPLGKLWPCYHAFEKWCGECESCQRFKRALREAGVTL